jgi:hypothetical protein
LGTKNEINVEVLVSSDHVKNGRITMGTIFKEEYEVI